MCILLCVCLDSTDWSVCSEQSHGPNCPPPIRRVHLHQQQQAVWQTACSWALWWGRRWALRLRSQCAALPHRAVPHCRIGRIESISIFAAGRDGAMRHIVHLALTSTEIFLNRSNCLCPTNVCLFCSPPFFLSPSLSPLPLSLVFFPTFPSFFLPFLSFLFLCRCYWFITLLCPISPSLPLSLPSSLPPYLPTSVVQPQPKFAERGAVFREKWRVWRSN